MVVAILGNLQASWFRLELRNLWICLHKTITRNPTPLFGRAVLDGDGKLVSHSLKLELRD